MSDSEICAEIYKNTDYDHPKEIFKFVGDIIKKNLQEDTYIVQRPVRICYQ